MLGFSSMRDAGVDTHALTNRERDRITVDGASFIIYIQISLTLTLAKGVLFDIIPTDMKFFQKLLLCACASVMISSAFAAGRPDPVSNYLPGDKMVEGSVVVVVFQDELKPFMDKMMKKISSYPIEKQKEFSKTIEKKPGQPVPYSESIGLTKEEYQKYLECWKKTEIRDFAPVMIGVFNSGERDVWNLVTLAQNGPLPLSTLKFNEKKNAWVSLNGELKFVEDIKHDDTNLYGAWEGKEWKLEKKDIFSVIAETITMAKTLDSKYAYIMYNIVETTIEGKMIDNRSICLRVPLSSLKADPLLEKAKLRAKKK